MECAKYIDRNVQGKSVEAATKQKVCEEDWGGGDVVVQSAFEYTCVVLSQDTSAACVTDKTT